MKKLAIFNLACATTSLLDAACHSIEAVEENQKKEIEDKKIIKLISVGTVIMACYAFFRTIDLGGKIYKLTKGICDADDVDSAEE